LLEVINMPKKEEVKQFSCLHCGVPYTAIPPDDFHPYASVKADDVDDPLKMTYRCKACGKDNTIYWGSQKVFFGVG